MSFERPRIRTDGPGGPDVKQGARIACLDCRTAKIRCSAPTDGKVPCTRCSRHGKDCVFEKHRRGRKPGRAGSHFGTGGSNEGQISPTYHFDQGLSVKRDVPHPKYRREGLTIDTGYKQSPVFQEAGSRGLPPSRYHPSSAHSLESSSHDAQNWSPSSNSSQRLHSVHSVPSSAGLRSASPAHHLYHDPAPSHSRTHSMHSLLSASREGISRDHYHYQPSSASSYTSSQFHHPLSATSSVMSGHAPPPPLSPRRQGNLNAPFGLNLGPMAPSFGMPTPTSASGAGLSPTSALNSRLTSYSSLNTPLNMPRFNLVDHQLTPGGMIPTSTLAPGTFSSKSWLDLPSPSARALLSPTHQTGGPLSSSLQSHALNPGSNAPFWPGAAITSSGTSSHHSYKRKPASDYFSGALPATQRETKEQHYERDEAMEDRLPTGGKKRRLESAESGEKEGQQTRSRTSSAARDLGDDEDEKGEEEQRDQLDEDEVDGQQNEDVLSTPLSLLAHASDAAAALKEGRNSISERRDSIGTKLMGAATMGLISPPAPKLAPPRRWFDDRLPRLGPRLPLIASQNQSNTLSPLLSRPQEREFQRPRSRHTEMAPPFGPLSRSAAASHNNSTPTPAPPGLGAIGRSRSYTTVESVNQPVSTFSPPGLGDKEEPNRSVVTDTERRAEVFGERPVTAAKRFDEVTKFGQSLAPSTLDHEAWEYRDGRARTRKSLSSSSGPGTSQSELSGKVAASGAGDAAKSKSSVSPATSTVKLPDSATSDAKKEENAAAVTVTPRRWRYLRRRTGSNDEKAATVDGDDLDATSEESETLGASHQDFFSLSIYHSKMDNESDMDPVNRGILEVREVEKLFDIFFARVNPVLILLDPFLHSVNYVRNRSALLTTVIAALAARLSDTARDAELAVRLDRYWRLHLLPEILMGGYKSVELSQAFLVLSLYQKPVNRLADDRSWQYLGFAIRIATEVGVNRATQANESVRENEQVRRRIRNRARLWISLFLTDRAFSFQTGRPWTVLEDEVIARSHLWHIEDFALPDDTRLVSSVKLTLLMADYVGALKDVTQHSRARPSLVESSNPFQWKEDVKALQYCLSKGLAELERWRDVWCAGALEDRDDRLEGSQTQAVAHLLDQWQGTSMRSYYYYRLNLCSRVMQALEHILSVEVVTAEEKGNEERIKSIKTEMATHIRKVSLDAWQSSIDMIESLLMENESEDLAAAPNQKAVTFIYGALAALRLTNSTHFTGDDEQRPDSDVTLDKCKALAQALIQAGSTPKHRNGAAASYGVYLDGIVSLWESNVVQESSAVSPNSPLDEGITPATENGGDNTEARVEVQVHMPALERRVVSSERIAFPPPSPIKYPSVVFPSQQHANQPLSFLQQQQVLIQQQQQALQQAQQHSVGDELWGTSAASLPETPMPNSVVGSDPETMDRMWDYLTTYPDPASGFPLNLWQPHSNWSAAATKAQQIAPTL